MRTLLAIDPGKATGWSSWAVPLTKPLRRLNYGVIPGGAQGFVEWWRKQDIPPSTVVFERFFLGDEMVNDRTMQASMIEGALLALVPSGVTIAFQRRADKRAVPDHVLVEHGLWLTGTQVGWEDGRDVNDSQIHALAWAKRQHHEPTLEAYFGP